MGKISFADREMLDSLRDRLRLTGTRVAEIEANALTSFRANPMSQESQPICSTNTNGTNQVLNPKDEKEYIEALIQLACLCLLMNVIKKVVL